MEIGGLFLSYRYNVAVRPKLIVIGGGLGGLSAAIHSQISGFDVKLIEQREVTGGKAASFSEVGYRFDPGPSIIILPEIYNDVFRRAGKIPADYLRFDPLDTLTRVYFRDEVHDIPADRSACINYLESIEKGAGAKMAKLLADFDQIATAIDASVFAAPILGWSSMANPAFLRMGPKLMAPKGYKAHIDLLTNSPLLRAFFYGFPS